MSDDPQIALIIVTYNAGAHIARCLESALAQSRPAAELIVWDNASTDDTVEVVRRYEPRVRLVAHDENLGFAAGNNRAVALCDQPWIALLNPDAFPAADWLEQLGAAAAWGDDVAMVGGVQRDAVDPRLLDGAGDVYHAAGQAFRGGYGKPAPEHIPDGEIFGPCAAAALYRRDAFDAVGGFDERFFCYHEDVDLAFRLRLAGWRAMFASTAVVDHVGSASTAKRSAFSVYHGSRNRLWTFVKCMPWPLLAVLWPVHAALTGALLMRDALTDRSAFRAGVRGVWHGLRGLGPSWRARRAVHRDAKASVVDIAQAMSWNPMTLVRRAPDIRPLAGQRKPTRKPLGRRPTG